jgi:hypothetical protein
MTIVALPVKGEYRSRISDFAGEGTSKLMAILGHPGSGKSMLLCELAEYAEDLDLVVINVVPEVWKGGTPAETFLIQFVGLIIEQLGLIPFKPNLWDEIDSSPFSKATEYVRKQILPFLGSRKMLIVIDDSDRILDAPWGLDFFRMLRGWHIAVAAEPWWGKISYLIAACRYTNELPGNILSHGNISYLEGFTLEQAEELFRLNCRTKIDVERIHASVCGDLTLLYCFINALNSGMTIDQTFEEAYNGSGHFQVHFDRYVRPSLANVPGIIRAAMKESYADFAVSTRLERLGILRFTQSSMIGVRHIVYRTFFERNLPPEANVETDEVAAQPDGWYRIHGIPIWPRSR